MTENSIDVNIVPVKNGMKRVVVSYYHYSRKEKDRMSSQTDYVWETTEMLIPEGSEHLFKDIYTAKADELYHHVLDKFGWAWRDPKYKSETELCAMLKWAKEKGLTIEELSI